MSVRLRRALAHDRYLLWLWANDPASRVASGDRPSIGWEDHCQWFAERGTSPNALVLIGETDAGQPVGTIRFETANDWRQARLSYAVAPESRGAGIGRELLRLGIDELRRRAPGAEIVAEVRGANAASVRLFQALGWEGSEGGDGWIRFVSGRVGAR
ncbi:MAG: N-acetyltransferase family protein [Gemmatimonadales bacterium]